jgi:hypothetical protein
MRRKFSTGIYACNFTTLTKPDAEFALNQVSHHPSRPYAEIQAILTRIITIDPTKDLRFLTRCETAWPSGCRPRRERTDGTPTPGFHTAASHL